DVTAANADGVVSSPLMSGPLLVVAVQLYRAGTGVGTTQVTVVDVPIRRDAVAGELLPIVGTLLFPAGPARALLAGAGEESLIGPTNNSTDAIAVWPWYLKERPGAIALWVRKSGVGTMAVQAQVSVWELEREAVVDEGPFLGQRAWARVVARRELRYLAPHASVFNGRR
ncbi:MAG: hypothetical protein ACREN5_01510, partial [Gemmatimonadales bacterium]